MTAGASDACGHHVTDRIYWFILWSEISYISPPSGDICRVCDIQSSRSCARSFDAFELWSGAGDSCISATDSPPVSSYPKYLRTARSYRDDHLLDGIYFADELSLFWSVFGHLPARQYPVWSSDTARDAVWVCQYHLASPQ